MPDSIRTPTAKRLAEIDAFLGEAARVHTEKQAAVAKGKGKGKGKGNGTSTKEPSKAAKDTVGDIVGSVSDFGAPTAMVKTKNG